MQEPQKGPGELGRAKRGGVGAGKGFEGCGWKRKKARVFGRVEAEEVVTGASEKSYQAG